MESKEQYFFYVQKFLDLVENVKDEELKNDVIRSFFSSINSLCKLADFDMNCINSIISNGKN